jgi:hypothetical protein
VSNQAHERKLSPHSCVSLPGAATHREDVKLNGLMSGSQPRLSGSMLIPPSPFAMVGWNGALAASIV